MNERDRIELIMKSYNLTPSQFADKTGIQRASVSHILSGRNKASLEVMLKIFEAFPGLDMQWLMTGKGNAPVGGVDSAEEVFATQPSLSPIQSELFSPVTAIVTESPVMQQQKIDARRNVVSERAPRRAARTTSPSTPAPAASRKIKEIRIFYTDGTYETMIPEK